jgi:hypothetical protein
LSLPIRLSLLACALLFTGPLSLGFCPKPDPSVACEFLNSDVVFIGKIVSVRTIPPHGEELDGWTYVVNVQEWFRGPHMKTIEVFTENNSGRFPLDVGKAYLLFAFPLGGRLTITNCGNSALLADAEGSVRDLRKMKVPQDAQIEGRISFSGIPDSGTHFPGIQILIRSRARTFKAVSDADGWFRLHVPPGKYSVEVQPTPHWNISPYDLSYDDPQKVIAQRGHCSGLQFIARPM